MAGWRAAKSCVRLAAIYAAIATPFFALWEVAQLPLYLIWTEQGAVASLRAAMHCTLGDAGLALASMLIALGGASLRAYRPTTGRLIAATMLGGFALMLAIELASITWLQRWAYGPAMPIIPLIGIGLSPALQWLIVPGAVLLALRGSIARLLSRTEAAG